MILTALGLILASTLDSSLWRPYAYGANLFFLLMAFIVPIGLLAAGMYMYFPELLVLAFVVQYLGLIAERWFFFAQANHPQNLYYQLV